KVSRWSNVFPPNYSRYCRGEPAVPCDDVITEFRNRSEAGNVLVAPPQPFFRAAATKRLINRFRRDENLTGLIDINNRVLELFPRNFWKTLRDFLIRRIVDFACGNFAPPFNPATAKMAVAIPNHERFRWRIGNAELVFHGIEVDRALRRAMLFKLLLVIPSAVEESLTTQEQLSLFFCIVCDFNVRQAVVAQQTNS